MQALQSIVLNQSLNQTYKSGLNQYGD